MKTKLTILCVVALMGFMLTSPASAGNIGPNAGGGGSNGANPASCFLGGSPAYCNTGFSGTTDGWTINFGFSVTDSFSLTAATTLTSAQIVTWESPGEGKANGISWSISTNPFGSTNSGNETSLSDTFVSTNQYGFNLDNWGFNLGSGVALGSGTYWLTLQNASVPSGDPIYWDENGGPSSAQENTIGTIPSETFAVYGSSGGGGGAPEPGTLVLGGSGLLLLAGALRRKLSR